ncbi:MAG: EAL domain-containing protein [Asticcacaulis sp.]|nr:EAL domain-containing protein [Asticcacaulis sp.]
MQSNGWQRLWQVPKTPFIVVLATGIAIGLAVMTVLVSLDTPAVQPQMVTIAILVGMLVTLLTATCLHGLKRASQNGEHDPQDLFHRADVTMHYPRQAGKRHLGDADDVSDPAYAERQHLGAEIRCGLINGEFDVAYQPICNAKTHEIEAVEALVRWPRRPDGELGPDAFIGAADSSGIIHRLGMFVLQRACSDLADIDTIRLHVNISPVQFHHPEFEMQVKSILDETGLPAERLELEITEGHILENPDRARAVIAALATRGIGFALDDFGAGVSGIGHLQRFGLRRVKIDRALVATIGRDPQAGMLLTGAVSIAHALSLSVVAEGVETEDQEKLLRLVGCDLLQGYRFGRPAYFNDMATRLAGTGRVLGLVS